MTTVGVVTVSTATSSSNHTKSKANDVTTLSTSRKPLKPMRTKDQTGVIFRMAAVMEPSTAASVDDNIQTSSGTMSSSSPEPMQKTVLSDHHQTVSIHILEMPSTFLGRRSNSRRSNPQPPLDDSASTTSSSESVNGNGGGFPSPSSAASVKRWGK
jgi:hypothetical protein